MKVVIFGATGKVGCYLVDDLLTRHPDISITAVGHRAENVFCSPRVEYIPCNIQDADGFRPLPRSCDAVINLAAAVTTRVNSSEVRSYIDANIIGAVNILDYALNADADRLLYAQTYNDVFGAPDSDILIRPDQPRKPRYYGEAALYAITKNTAVDLAYYYQHQYGLKAFVFRMPTVYSYTPSPYYLVAGEKRVRPFRKMIQQAIDGEPIEIWGDPNHVMDMVYIKDCCQMFSLGLTANVDGGTYNVGTGVGTTLQQQVEGMISVFSPKESPSPIVYRPEKPNGKAFIMDIENARRELGYVPKYDYISMLKDFKREMEQQRFPQIL